MNSSTINSNLQNKYKLNIIYFVYYLKFLIKKTLLKRTYSKYGRPNHREPKSVVLPFNINPPLTTHLYSAYPCGIVTSDGPLSVTICHHHLQLFFPSALLGDEVRPTDHVRFYPGFGLEQFEAIGMIKRSEWENTERIHSARKTTLLKIIEGLTSGRYIHIYVDEYYIPKTRFFGLSHNIHELLLIGFDSKRETVIGVTYLRDGSFGQVEIPYYLLLEAIYSNEWHRKDDPPNPIVVRQIERLHPQEKPLDQSAVREQIRDYVNGIDNSEKYLKGKFSSPFYNHAKGVYIFNGSYDYRDRRHIDGAYGISIYDSYVTYIKNCLEKRAPIDMRATRILVEHKTILSACLRPLVTPASARKCQDLPELKRIIQLARGVHMAAFTFNLKYDPSIGKDILNKISELRELERETLSAVIDGD